MTRINLHKGIPDARITYVSADLCVKAPYSPSPSYTPEQRDILQAQVQENMAPLHSCYAIKVGDTAQILTRWEDVEILQNSPGASTLKIPILIGAGPSGFTKEEIVRVVLSPSLPYPAGNPYHRAQAIQLISEWMGMTHQQIANATGENRTTISNTVRLLDLHPKVIDYVTSKKVSFTLARSLAGKAHDEQIELAEKAVNTKSSVNKLLGHGRGKKVDTNSQLPTPNETPPTQEKSRDIIRLEEQITNMIGYPCNIVQHSNSKRGRLVLKPFDEAGLSAIADAFPKDMFKARAQVSLDFENNDDLYDLLSKVFPPEDEF